MKKKIAIAGLTIASGAYGETKNSIEVHKELAEVHCPVYSQKMKKAQEVNKEQLNKIPQGVVQTEGVSSSNSCVAIPVVEKGAKHMIVAKDRAKAKKSNERTIFIANKITKDMITYKKHWTGYYTPATFIVKVNDQELKNDETTPIQVKNDTVQLTFNYEFKVFGKVHRAGGRVVTYKVPKNLEKITSTFSWDAASNIILDKECELVSCNDLA